MTRAAFPRLSLALLVAALAWPARDLTATSSRVVELKCPICGEATRGLEMSSTNSHGGMDRDLLQRASGGQWVVLAPATCPRCLFSGPVDEFRKPADAALKKKILEERALVLPAHRERNPVDPLVRSLTEGQDPPDTKLPAWVRHDLACQVLRLRGAEGGEIVFAWMHAAWACRLEENPFWTQVSALESADRDWVEERLREAWKASRERKQNPADVEIAWARDWADEIADFPPARGRAAALLAAQILRTHGENELLLSSLPRLRAIFGEGEWKNVEASTREAVRIERSYQRKALDRLEALLGEGKDREPESEDRIPRPVLLYLAGEISRRLGEFDGSLRWFSEAARGPSPEGILSEFLPEQQLDVWVHQTRGGKIPLERWIADLAGETPAARLQAARVIRGLGASAVPAIPALLAALDRGDASLNAASADALARLGRPAASSVAALLERKEEERRRQGIEILGAMGPRAAEALPALVRSLDDGSPENRAKALWALGRLGREAGRALPVLLDRLGSPDPGLRRGSAAALGATGLATAEVVGGLTGRLSDEDLETRKEACRALGALGAGAAKAVPDIRKSAERAEGGCQAEAILALGGIGEAASEAVPTLAAAAKGGSPSVRAAVARALGKMGLVSKEAVTTLAALLGDRDEELFEAVEEAMNSIGDKPCPGLVAALRDEDPGTKKAGLTLISGFWGLAPKEVVPLVLELAGTPDPEMRLAALHALASLQMSVDIGKSALPALLKSLKDPDNRIRSAALQVLEEIGEGAREALPAVFAMLEDKDGEVRGRAVLAVSAVGKREEVERRIEGCLRDPDEYVQRMAEKSLRRLREGR